MKNNFQRLVGSLDNQMLNTNIRGYENSDITDEKKREIYKHYLEKEFPEFAEEIYNLTEANFIEEETEMENNIENHLGFAQSLMEDEKMETLEKINSRRKAIIEWNRTKQQLGEWTEELEKESKEKLERLENMEQEVKKMAQKEEMEMEKIYLLDLQKDFVINWTSLNESWLEDDRGYYTTNQESADWIRRLVEAMQLLADSDEDYTYVSDEDIVEWAEAIREEKMEIDWKEFAELQEVQVDQSPTGTGNALFYNDENIIVSVDIDGDHDDTTLWEDEELIKELQELVKLEYADIYSSIRPSRKEVS